MNNTLGNGLDLLAFLSGTAEAYSVSELARRLDLPKSHVHRLLRSLVEHGYAVQDEDRRYRIGMEPLVVSKALLANHPLRRAARPHLHRLAAATGLDAIVTIPHRDGAALVIDAVHPDGEQRDPASHIGNRLAFPGSATGRLFAVGIPGFADPGTLPAGERRSIQRTRLALRDPGMRESHNGLACAIRDPAGGVVGGFGLSGPRDPFAAAFDAAAVAIAAAAAAVEAALALRPTA